MSEILAVTAGFLAGEVAGKSWEELVNERIYTPLGMTRSNTSTAETQKHDDFASPHVTAGGVVKSTEFYNYQKFGVGPNGAVNSTVNDLVKYLDFHLGKGKPIISTAQMTQLHKPVTATGTGGYALGWNVYSHRGHTVWEHGGAITGFTSMMVLLPEEKTGIVVLNNLDSRLPTVVAWDLADKLLGLEPRDYLSEARKAPDQSRKAATRVPGTKPTLELAAYT